MGKTNSLLLAFALLGSSVGAWAQTDVTDKISNPNITGQTAVNVVPTGWTAGPRKTNNDHYTEGTGDTQLEAWSNRCMFFDYYQDITVDNGIYTVSAKCHDTNGIGGYLYISSGGSVAKVLMTTDYSTITTDKIIVTTGKLRIGIKLDASTHNTGSWITGDDFKLTKYDDDVTPEQYTELYNTTLTDASAYCDKALSAETRTALEEAIVKTVDLTTKENAITAVASIGTALENAQAFVENTRESLYGGANTGWTNSPEVNTWSTEGEDYGKDMKVPFLQYWKDASNGNLDDKTFEYTLSNLAAGTYDVSILARAVNQNGTSGITLSGATFTANDNSLDLTTGDDCTNGKYGRYTTTTTVGSDGALKLTINIASANFNWLAWKDIQVTYHSTIALKAPLKAALEEANAYYTNSTDNEANTAKSAYKTVIDEAQKAYDDASSKTAMQDAITNLQTAYQTFALSGAMPTEGHPFDLTFTLTNPSFENNNAEGWTYASKPGFQTYGNAEYYNTAFDIYQTIKNLPQAYYKLKVKAFQRPGWANAVAPAYVNAEDKADGTANVSAEIYVNSGSQKIKNIASPLLTTKLGKGGDESEVTVNETKYYMPNDMNSADKYFSSDYYENEIELICTTGEAKMGFRCTEKGSGGYWTIFDDFRLYLTKELDLAAYQTVYRNAITEAQRTISLNPDVKGKEKADLDALIAAAEPSTIDALKEATEKIETAATTYAAANDSWKRYAYAAQAATKADVTYTDFSTDNTKTAADAKTAANSLFVSALTKAYAEVNGYTLGFEANEYAPYNLVAVESVLGNLIVDGEVSADKVAAADGKDLLAAVTDAYSCTANTEEVNAIYDGTLKNAPIQATAANVELPGWNTVSGNIRQTFQGETSKACLAGADDNTGVFVHPGTYQYGNAAGYTMPLKAGYYRVAAKYCAWEGSSNNGFGLTILKKDGDAVATKSFAANKNDVSKSDAFANAVMDFEVKEAGDYVLSVYANGNTFMTDFYILKATAADLTLDEDATYSPEAAYANVTLKRTLVEGWNGLVLPFDMTIEDAKAKFNASDVKAFSGISVDATNGTTLTFEDATSIEVGVPVMVKVNTASTSNEYSIDGVFLPGTALTPKSYTESGVTYSFKGTYANENLTGQTFALIQGSHFYNYDGTETSVSAKTFRAYFLNETPEVSSSKLNGFDFGDMVTGITEVKRNADGNADKMFDLQGRSVKNAAKGLYIKNGKKVIVK